MIYKSIGLLKLRMKYIKISKSIINHTGITKNYKTINNKMDAGYKYHYYQMD